VEQLLSQNIRSRASGAAACSPGAHGAALMEHMKQLLSSSTSNAAHGTAAFSERRTAVMEHMDLLWSSYCSGAYGAATCPPGAHRAALMEDMEQHIESSTWNSYFLGGAQSSSHLEHIEQLLSQSTWSRARLHLLCSMYSCFLGAHKSVLLGHILQGTWSSNIETQA